MAARIGNQIYVKAPNRVGMMAEITGAIAGAGVNIDAICAYAMEDEAHFMIVVADSAKAISALENYEIKEDEVVIVELDNRVGTASDMADKLKAANIDIEYIYGTTSGSGLARLIFSSNNNAEAVEVLS